MLELKRIEVRTLKRILNHLSSNPGKRVQTAMYCNMAYDRFIPYVNMLCRLELISQTITKDGIILNVTQRGRELFNDP